MSCLSTSYHTGFTYQTFSDDVALVKLASKVNYTDFIRPVCLVQSERQNRREQKGLNVELDSEANSTTANDIDDEPADMATVVGWGKLHGGKAASQLQEVRLPIVKHEKCKEWFKQMQKFITIR